MPVEIGSLVARGTFGVEPQKTRTDEDLREDLREVIAEVERRRKGR